MSLTREEVLDIATYARIALTDEELDEMTSYMNDTVEMLSVILEFNLEGVQPTFHPIGSLSNVMTEDEPNAHDRSLSTREALGNAASAKGQSFRVPTILKTDEDDGCRT